MSSQIQGLRPESIPEKAIAVTKHDVVTSSSSLAIEGRIDDTATGATAPCRLVATSPITISGSQVIDGVTTTTGDRILRAGESTQANNGTFLADNGGPWFRSSDTLDPATTDAILITEGSAANAGSLWRCTHTAKPVLNTDLVTFARVFATDTMIGSRVANDASAYNSLTGVLTDLLSLFARRFKDVLGTPSALDAAATNLFTVAAHYLAKGSAVAIGHAGVDGVTLVADGNGFFSVATNAPLPGVHISGWFVRDPDTAPDNGLGGHTMSAAHPICFVDTTVGLSVGVMNYTVTLPPTAGAGTIPIGATIEIWDAGGMAATAGKNIILSANGNVFMDGAATKTINANWNGARLVMNPAGNWQYEKLIP